MKEKTEKRLVYSLQSLLFALALEPKAINATDRHDQAARSQK
jgi:hypothetical protein